VHCGPKEEEPQQLQEILAQELHARYLPKTRHQIFESLANHLLMLLFN